ncbi:DoxX family protein, partial [Flavobacteriaceae bacterium]|nr:DoxX family protein [Flavobacteriaceae bacterium]
MKQITNISRILVGVLFIISGLIKLNDPVGFSFKLKDYFAPDVLNIE